MPALSREDFLKRYGRYFNPRRVQAIQDLGFFFVEGPAEAIPRVAAIKGLEVKSLASAHTVGTPTDSVRMVEATVSYNSPFIGRTLKELNFRHRFELLAPHLARIRAPAGAS